MPPPPPPPPPTAAVAAIALYILHEEYRKKRVTDAPRSLQNRESTKIGRHHSWTVLDAETIARTHARPTDHDLDHLHPSLPL